MRPIVRTFSSVFGFVVTLAIASVVFAQPPAKAPTAKDAGKKEATKDAGKKDAAKTGDLKLTPN